MTRFSLRLPFPISRSLPLAATSGLLYYACFPPLSLWPLAAVALVPLQLALHGQPPKRAAQLGLVTGTFLCFPGFFWLVALMRTHGGFPPALALLFLLVLSLYQAGQFALCAWLHARACSRNWPPELVFPLAFACSELLFPQLFPWYFGACLHGTPLAIQCVDLAGPVLLSLLALLPNIALTSLLTHALGHPRPLRIVGSTCAALLASALLYGHIRIRQADQREARAPSLNVGVVQTNIPMDLQGASEHLRYLKRHLDLTQELQDKGAQFVVWSESSLTYVVPEQDMEGFLSRSALRHLRGPVLLGAVVEHADQLWNTALLLEPGARVAGRYDKQYLLAFGEHIPLGDTFPFLYRLSPASQRFTAGSSMHPIVLRGRKLAVSICYEDILTALVNRSMQAEPADLLVNLTNDAWFGRTEEPWSHLLLAKLRAVEHRRYLVRATNSGVSAIVDSSGRVRAQTETFQEASLLAQVKLLTGTTLYERIGQAPIYVASAAALAMAFAKRRVSGGLARSR